MDKYTHKYNVILDNMDLNEYRLRPISAIMYLQDSFARYCAIKGVAAFDLFPKHLYWVVGEFNVEFVDEMPFWSEEITTEIWISEITKLKIYTDYKIYYKDNVFAQGNGCWFLIDELSGRPAKTDLIAEKFVICNELALGEHKKFTQQKAQKEICEIKHKNNLSDIDFNNHVNNKSYMNIAEAALSAEYKKSHKLKNIHIRFNRESYLDDVLLCKTYQTEKPNDYVHTITKDGISVCDVRTGWEEKRAIDKIIDFDLELKKF